MEVVELQGRPADAVRRDQVQEAARQLHQCRGDEREILLDASHQRRCPCHRHERIEDQREQRPAPYRVLELGLDRLPIDPLEAGDPDPDREQHAGEHPDVDPRETLDLERGHVLDPGGRREIRPHLLQGLAEMLASLGRSRRQRRRLHVRDDLSEPFPSQSRERRGDRAIVADELRADDEQRRDVALQPIGLGAHVRGPRVEERDLAVVDDQASRVELTVRDARCVQLPELLPRRGQYGVSHALTEIPERDSGHLIRDQQTRRRARRRPVLRRRGARTPVCSARSSPYARCSTCCRRVPNTGTPGAL